MHPAVYRAVSGGAPRSGDADEVSVDVEDERVTILRAVAILDAAMNALDESMP
jgi:hypothetical protein